jgi:hypothetical protein
MVTYQRAAADSIRAFRSLGIFEIKFTNLTQQMSLMYYVSYNSFFKHIFALSGGDDSSQIFWFCNEKCHKQKYGVVKDTETNEFHFWLLTVALFVRSTKCARKAFKITILALVITVSVQVLLNKFYTESQHHATSY